MKDFAIFSSGSSVDTVSVYSPTGTGSGTGTIRKLDAYGDLIFETIVPNVSFQDVAIDGG